MRQISTSLHHLTSKLMATRDVIIATGKPRSTSGVFLWIYVNGLFRIYIMATLISNTWARAQSCIAQGISVHDNEGMMRLAQSNLYAPEWVRWHTGERPLELWISNFVIASRLISIVSELAAVCRPGGIAIMPARNGSALPVAKATSRQMYRFLREQFGRFAVDAALQQGARLFAVRKVIRLKKPLLRSAIDLPGGRRPYIGDQQHLAYALWLDGKMLLPASYGDLETHLQNHVLADEPEVVQATLAHMTAWSQELARLG